MTYDQLVGHFGGPTKAADALGIEDRRTVHAWSRRRVPSRWQMKAEKLTDGKLRADKESRREAVEFASYLNGEDKRVAA